MIPLRRAIAFLHHAHFPKMKITLLRVLPFLALSTIVMRADDEKIIAAVRAADDARVIAIKTADHDGLMASFSEELHYVHANGQVDTKASYGKRNHLVHPTFEYKQRKFLVAAPGVVVETGRLVSQWTRDGKMGPMTDAQFVGVWREEDGKWHILAWQSASIPPAAPAKQMK
jgi:hypothetical protein